MKHYIQFTTISKDPGSVYVGSAINELPAQYRRHGAKPDKMYVQMRGDTAPRPVTYIMGSRANGFYLCSKGSKPFPTGIVSVIITAGE